CMKVREKGYLVVYNPYAELYHYESKSRGLEDTPEKVARFAGEIDIFKSKWEAELKAGDPFYNPNLSLTRVDYSLRDE
ncbi:MAG: glycosyltransferase family 2 protein, partial [Lachnospiraceae bacterium]|nr:glycosyltransferase family 2 protein [Lachnospiraceae bacterium]